MTPKVSVIIPCYNSERFVKATLDSVVAQTYPSVEVIVIDDGSTDGTRATVEAFTDVHYHYQTNSGPAAARNAGYRLAVGDYLAFLDSDDLWKPHMLSACVQMLDTKPNIDAIHSNWLPIDAEGNVTGDHSGWQPWRGDLFECLLIHIPFNTSSFVWRRECWERIGGFDETPEINDDWINWLRIARLGYQFDCIERPLVHRRLHPGGITRRQAQRVIQWRLNALDQICPEFDVPDHLRRQAYAEAYWVGTTVALAQANYWDAISHFRQAVVNDPTLLEHRSTYYAIAYGADRDTQRPLDVSAATTNIQAMLNGLFSSSDLPESIAPRERRVWGAALFCLAQMAYGSESASASVARRLLGRSVLLYPRLVFQAGRLRWLLRIILGRQLIRYGQRILGWHRSDVAFRIPASQDRS